MQETSLIAYSQIKSTLGNRHQAVMEAFAHRHNFTNSELARYLNWPINTVTPRVFELRKKNMLREAGTRTCQVTGRRALTWELCMNTLF